MHFRQLNLLAFLLHTFKAAICWQKLILLCCNVKVSGVGFFFLSTQKPDTSREGLTLFTVPLITKAEINSVNITEI